MKKILLTNNSLAISEDGKERATDLVELRSLFPVQKKSVVLPTGTVYYSKKGVKQHFLLETPLQKRRIYSTHDRREFERTVWWPPSLWSIIIDAEKEMHIHMVFLNQSFHESEDSSPTYYSPYGNHYGETNICWDEMVLPKIYKETDLERVPSLFFDSIFNGDILHGMMSGGTHIGTSLRMMLESGENDEFLDTLLHKDGASPELLNAVDGGGMRTMGSFIRSQKTYFRQL